MQGQQAVDMMAQHCAQAFVNNLEYSIEDKVRASETMEAGFLNKETGKYTVIRVTVVVEPQIFNETVYSGIETSVTDGMRILESNNETTIPEHSDF